MANPTLDYRSVLDMHAKSKTIEPELRPEVVNDLRVIFSGMYPKVRLVYHRPAASISKPEHIYVVFDRFHTRQQFCRTRKIHNPLRTVYTHNSGPNEIADYILQAIEELLGVANEGEVMFSGPLFEQAEQDMNEGDEEENLYEAFLEALSGSSNEGGDDTQVTSHSSHIDPPRTQSELQEIYLKGILYNRKLVRDHSKRDEYVKNTLNL
ncbi:hypothetical protein RSOLAG22IIIB_10832 [Rhizoctonia solani]|uniref:Uncharacterized protein n=1 Tax=Rhizoctonia solani TaxID=456999 RepID=A0A0K6G536_9AGAM|nr:hypothetical protein RSOLAG22IIIB_10832 [Rhizoctonia solani]